MSEQTLGKYTIVRPLGAGGMAEVYLCRLRGIGGFDKQVVIKRIRPEIKDEGYIDMFMDEARLAANLSHPNIVQVFEIDEADGLPYIAMEYVRGPTLSNALYRLKDGPRPYGLLACILANVAAGLHYAHNARDAAGNPLRIVHRDISPHNVIVSMDGTPKVFDFGVAKSRGNLALTGIGAVKGKIAYMATEQLRGQPVDYRADIYALGVCLYEATLGRRPFRGDTEAELFAARVEGVFPRPSELEARYPQELEQIVLAAMSPDPEARPSGADLQTALTDFATGIHAATTKDVAEWVSGLFPDDAKELTGEAYAYSVGSGPGSRSGNRNRSSKREALGARVTPQSAVSVPMSRAPLWLGGLLFATAAAGGVAYYEHRKSAEEAPPSTPLAAALNKPARSAADELRLYLDEAERLADAHRWDAAAELLVKAKKLDVGDAALDVRTSKVADRIETGQLRQSARHALDTHDGSAASKAIDVLLDRVPDDADGQKMLGELHALTTPANPGAIDAASGKLSVLTHARAAVYLDGVLVDHGSFARRPEPAGSHELVVRLAGFASVHRTITIAADKESKLSLPLSATTERVATAHDAPHDSSEPVPHDAAPPPPQPAITPDAALAKAPPPRDPAAAPALDAGAASTAIAAPRLPGSYSARTMKELSKVLAVVEGEAIDRGSAPGSIRGVTNGIAEAAFSNFAPGQLIEIHPTSIYYAIVRAARAGKTAGAITAELRSAYTQGKL